jgi:hypothetical protein
MNNTAAIKDLKYWNHCGGEELKKNSHKVLHHGVGGVTVNDY